MQLFYLIKTGTIADKHSHLRRLLSGEVSESQPAAETDCYQKLTHPFGRTMEPESKAMRQRHPLVTTSHYQTLIQLVSKRLFLWLIFNFHKAKYGLVDKV